MDFPDTQSSPINDLVTITVAIIAGGVVLEPVNKSSDLFSHDRMPLVVLIVDVLIIILDKRLFGEEFGVIKSFGDHRKVLHALLVHEDIGFEYLRKFFKKEVVEPIKYHVMAKRYLARNKKYFNYLSDASKTSLKLQGGILNNNQSKKFEKKDYFKNSIKLRKFDEAAKKNNIKMKPIDDYKDLLISQLL